MLFLFVLYHDLMTDLLYLPLLAQVGVAPSSEKGAHCSQHAVAETTLLTPHYTTYYSHKLGALKV